MANSKTPQNPKSRDERGGFSRGPRSGPREGPRSGPPTRIFDWKPRSGSSQKYFFYMLSSLFNVFLAFSSLKFGTGESNLVLVSKIWYWPVKFGTGESNLVLVSKIWYYKEYLPTCQFSITTERCVTTFINLDQEFDLFVGVKKNWTEFDHKRIKPTIF